MTLLTLLTYIAIGAAGLTLLIGLLRKGKQSWVIAFLQYFCGILFIISGFVKAVDPLGTAFKMEQYFTEFEYTFAETSMNFLAPLFPWLSSISVLFSIFMIVFEIALGVMLLVGWRPKLTSWLFLLLVVFFTFLTGFTFMTGYVPSGINFFDFKNWGPYTATNMRVTDCGCFGDFIKLEPRISFFKDLGLLIPAIIFVIANKKLNQIFTTKGRNIVVGIAALIALVFCLRNTYWGEPVVDFRPFTVGTNIYEKKTAEEEAASSVKIIAWKIQNNASGEVKELANEVYMKELANYPKTEWTVVDQIKSEPAIPETKISQFSVISPDGFDVAEDILTDSGDVFMIIAYKLKGIGVPKTLTVPDTVWVMDTIAINVDSIVIVKSVGEVRTKEVTAEVYEWDKAYVEAYTNKVNPLMNQVIAGGAKVYAVGGGAGTEKLNQFKEATKAEYDWYEADDILLKTIMRSNPGVIHMKAGKIINKWHITNLPKQISLQQ